MNRFLFLLFIFAYFLKPTFAADGGGAGNGGDIIFCDWRRPYVIDYYEATMHGYFIKKTFNHFDTTDEKQSVQSLVEYITIHLEGFNRGLEANNRSGFRKFRRILKRKLRSFPGTSEWINTSSLKEINDSNHQYMLPLGCSIRQVAINDDGIISVNENYFALLDQEQKNILFLHEFLYHIGKKYYGHQNSFKTRWLIRTLLRASLDRKKNIMDLNFLSALKYFLNKNDYKNSKFESSFDTFVYPFNNSLLDILGTFRPESANCPEVSILSKDITQGVVDIEYKGKLFENVDISFIPVLKSDRSKLFEVGQFTAYFNLIDKKYPISTPSDINDSFNIAITKDGELGLSLNFGKDCVLERY